MTFELALSTLAILIAGLAALYARWSAREAKRANDIGRLNALLALSANYQTQMAHQVKFADEMRGIESALEAARTTFDDLDAKHREVSREINKYHAVIVSPK